RAGRNRDTQHQKRHGDGEDPIAQRLQPPGLLALLPRAMLKRAPRHMTPHRPLLLSPNCFALPYTIAAARQRPTPPNGQGGRENNPSTWRAPREGSRAIA